MMKTEPSFYYCEHCFNLVEMVHDSHVPIICCGQSMVQLIANTKEGAAEKHLPLVEQQGSEVLVTVGTVMHPMGDDHSIEWVYLQTQQGCQRVNLAKDQSPAASFALVSKDSAIAAYAYCNLHGLWATKI